MKLILFMFCHGQHSTLISLHKHDRVLQLLDTMSKMHVYCIFWTMLPTQFYPQMNRSASNCVYFRQQSL